LANGHAPASPNLDISGGINVSAGIAIDLGDVVDGWVTADAGAFFDLEVSPGHTDLTFGGDVVISGGVEAFDLISLTMFVSIVVAYDSGSGDLTGSAEFHVEVHVLFFSASFTTSVGFTEHLGPGTSIASVKNVLPQRTAWDDHLERRRMFT
jgi:hypothetical protein